MIDIAKRAEKQNTLREKQAVVRLHLMDHFAKYGAEIDRWGHIKYEARGRTKRLKIMEKVVRHEVKTSAGWVRIQSYSFSNLYKTAIAKGVK